MKDKRKKIGNINYHGQIYEVYWELDTNLVWVLDDKGYWSNYGDKAIREDAVLECAIEMLKTSRQ